MASLVGVFAASHGPLIARDWQILPAHRREHFQLRFREMGRRFEACRPDVLIEIAPDHWSNFFLDNLPSVCIGVGEAHDGPPEPFLKDFPHKNLLGHPRFGMHLAETALKEDFEPSLSHHLRLDHGFCIPLLRMELKTLPAIVPMTINDLEPPMPSIRRCLAWGRLIARAIDTYPEPLRVAILATGGLSHSIGEPTMGAIDETFDHEFLRLLQAGADQPLIDYLEDILPRIGNGAHEVRNWVVAHAAAGSRGFDLIDYEPVPEVYVGCGYASWNLPEARKAAA
jgi:aromatic ring-opening dioxygenase catalytic subunit (LigB family)